MTLEQEKTRPSVGADEPGEPNSNVEGARSDNDPNTKPTVDVQGFVPFAIIPNWVLRSGGKLSTTAVQLYGVIMTYADNESKTAFPEHKTLAKDMGVSVSTIKRAIKNLEDQGVLIVQRRRNKRTGHYYANHYQLVLNDPWVNNELPPKVTDEPITRPTFLTKPTNYFTSEQSSEPNVSPAFFQNDGTHEPGPQMTPEKADPISPEFYESEDRTILINNVQEIATCRKQYNAVYRQTNETNQIAAAADHLANIQTNFENNLAIAFPDADETVIESMMMDYGWEPPLKAANERYTAAKWFNKFINSLRQETCGLTWRNQQ